MWLQGRGVVSHLPVFILQCPGQGLCLLMVCATFQVRDGPWEILILICSLERRKKAERGGRGEGRKERKRREEGGGEREKKRRR